MKEEDTKQFIGRDRLTAKENEKENKYKKKRK